MLLLLLSHFSRVRLCDPIDGSPPGSPVPGILQARTLEWVTLSICCVPYSLKGLPWWFDGKESACNAGDPGSISGWEDPPEKGMETHSSILAWRIPCAEELVRLQSMGSQGVRHDWATNTEPLERKEANPDDTLILAQWTPFWISDLQNCKIINVCYFKPIILWVTCYSSHGKQI